MTELNHRLNSISTSDWLKAQSIQPNIQPMSTFVGNIISNRLADLKKTQGWLAEQADVSNNAVSKWIKTGGISREKAVVVARVLDVSLDALLVAGAADGRMPAPTAGREISPTLNAQKPQQSEGYKLSLGDLLMIHAISEKEAMILRRYRLATARGKEIIEDSASGTTKQGLAAVADDEAES